MKLTKKKLRKIRRASLRKGATLEDGLELKRALGELDHAIERVVRHWDDTEPETDSASYSPAERVVTRDQLD